MKYVWLFLLLASCVFLCVWKQLKPVEKPLLKQKNNSGVKWNDSLMRHLPKGIDTSIIVKDIHGTPLKFRQYIIPVFNHEAIIYQDRGEWRLHRLNDASQDSLKNDDYAVASWERWDAYRNPDTLINAQEKLKKIAHILGQADYVLVLKSKRKLIVKRKGIQVCVFHINMGWAPVGNKEFDGDGKTPEGIYHLDNKYEREDKFHKSFWISYPNKADKLRAKAKGLKPGVGIMIHGTYAEKTLAKDWTAGCIAMQNKDLDTLFNYIASGTLIEIRK